MTGNSFGKSNSLELEFGLGDCQQIDSIKIEWPSGQIDRFLKPPVNSWWVAAEGAEYLRKVIH